MDEVPNTKFNFDFWEKCSPKRSTYPACRAVIAAKTQGDNYEEKMIYAIQSGYYQQARNPSNESTLCQFAHEIGLNVSQFSTDLNSAKTQATLLKGIQFSKQIGGRSFPSLFLQTEEGYRPLTLSYTDADFMLRQIPIKS